MKHFNLVERLGGRVIGIHFVALLPRVGDHLIGPDRTIWKVEAVGHYTELTDRPPQGPFGDLQVAVLATA